MTRDYGAEPVLTATESGPSESETVIRMLDREAEIETRYGGGFVQAIEGVEGTSAEGRSSDWFFFVNGIESDRGAAEVPVRGGDRIWWDYRDWTDALRTPAVVGSWPEPFAQAGAGADRVPVRVECRAARPACAAAAERLADEGVEASVEDPGASAQGPGLRLLVGAWGRVRADPLAARLERGPAASGVFARLARGGSGERLLALDPSGDAARALGAGAGLVAALREGDRPPDLGGDRDRRARGRARGRAARRRRARVALRGRDRRRAGDRRCPAGGAG